VGKFGLPIIINNTDIVINNTPKRLRTFIGNEPILNKILLTLKSKIGRKKIIAKKPRRKSKIDNQKRIIIKKDKSLPVKEIAENKTTNIANRLIIENKILALDLENNNDIN